MFAAPPETKAVVHAVVPDELRQAGRKTDWTRIKDKLGQYPNVDSFLEGPAFDRDGNLHMVNIPFGQILTYTATGEWKVTVEYDGEPNGLAIHADGRFYLADSKWGIVVADPATGEVEHLCTRVGSERFKGCNDLVFAKNGDLYFTDQGLSGLNDPTGRVFRLTAEGRLDCLIDNVPSPNGIGLSPDDRTLFVAVTRDNSIWRIPLNPDGSINRAGKYIQLSGSLGGPDGIALDERGGMVVAQVHFGSLWVFDEWGEPSWRVRTEHIGRRTTNVCFGGQGNRSIFVTETATGSILRADLPVAGLPLYSHS
jgi:gluconolactonase